RFKFATETTLWLSMADCSISSPASSSTTMVANTPLVAIALVAPRAEASDVKISADVRASLDQFFRQTPGAHELANNAAGVLVFPTVTGFGVGGGYGEGARLLHTSPSCGLWQ